MLKKKKDRHLPDGMAVQRTEPLQKGKTQGSSEDTIVNGFAERTGVGKAGEGESRQSKSKEL